MDEKPIEKLLRAAAEKRRAEAAETPSLHPVNRRLLQAEVQKVYGRRESPTTFLSALSGLWPQIGWSFAVVVGIAVAASMMLPHNTSREMTLAKNEPASSSTEGTVTGSRSFFQGEAKREVAQDSSLSARSGAENQRASLTSPAAGQPAPTAVPTERPALATSALADEKTANKPAARSENELVSTDRMYKEKDKALQPRTAISPGQTLAEHAAPAPSAPASTSIATSPAPSASAGLGGPVTRSRMRAPLSDVGVKSEEASQPVAANGRDDRKQDRYAKIQQPEQLAAASANATAAMPPAPAGAIAAAGSTFAFFDSNSAAVARQKFVSSAASNVLSDTSKLASEREVLASFDFEQHGESVRIIDNDGSIYDGAVERTPVAERRLATTDAVALQSQTKDATLDRSAPLVLFSVSGTNRTLGQFVTFKGELSPQPMPVQNALKKPAASLTVTNAITTVSVPLSNAQISGRISIGAQREVEFRARPQNAQERK